MSRTRTDVDRLARMLDGERSALAEADADERALAGLAALLSQAAPAVPPLRDHTRSALRAQLVAASREARSEGAGARARDLVRRLQYSTRLAGATGMAALALSSGGMAAAADRSLPGDALYGLGQVLEDARVAVTVGGDARGRLQLAYAAARLDEVEQLLARGDGSEHQAVALADAAELGREGSQALLADGTVAAAEEVLVFTVTQAGRLEALLLELQGEALLAASEVLQGLQEAAAAAEEVVDRDAGADPAGPTTPTDQQPDAPVAPFDDPQPAAPSAPGGDGEPQQPAAPPEPAPPSSGLPGVDVPGVEVPGVELPDVDVPTEVDQAVEDLHGAAPALDDLGG